VVIWGWFEIFSNFGLNTFLTREVARRRDEANRYLVNTTILRLALALAGLPLLGGFLALRQLVVSPPLEADAMWTIGLLYGGLFFSTISTGLTALFYAYEKAEYPAAIQTISTMLVASLGVAALLLGFGIVGLAAVSIIVSGVTLAILIGLTIRMFFRPRWEFDLRLQRAALAESFPLMINHLLATLFFRMDIVLLEAMTSATVVGWYGVVYKWIDAINVIPSFFTQALFPIMSRQALEDRAALRRSYVFSVKLLSLISMPLAVITTLLAYFLIGLLGGSQFLPHGAIALQIFVWSIPIGWINSVTNYVVIALNRQRTLTWAFVVGVVFNATANLIFIRYFSYRAAAVITIFSELVLLTFFYLVMKPALGRVPWVRVLGRITAATALMAAATWALAQVSVPLALAGGIAVYGVAVVLLRPFDAEELGRIAEIMPERVRARLAPGVGIGE
ncbi:MAG TPA: flippase, partial [Chloroflexi bacterium]|nr:flippase [Chloroflexota bacterium]